MIFRLENSNDDSKKFLHKTITITLVLTMMKEDHY